MWAGVEGERGLDLAVLLLLPPLLLATSTMLPLLLLQPVVSHHGMSPMRCRSSQTSGPLCLTCQLGCCGACWACSGLQMRPGAQRQRGGAAGADWGGALGEGRL